MQPVGVVDANTPAVTYAYEDGADGNGNAQYLRLRSMTYPGGRVVYYGYESTPTGRAVHVSEDSGGTNRVVEYTYLGWSTIVKETRPSVSGGLNFSYGSSGSYAGWDRFGRIVYQEWRKDDGTLVDGYTYSYDRAGDRTSRGNLLNSDYDEGYSYDGLSRLVDTNRNGTDLQDWDLDALGNWSGFTDGALSQTRESNAANEITGISGNWADPTYDAAGNMTSGPKAGEESTRLHFVYDAWNRLVAVLADDSGEPGAAIASYSYDGRGYRVQKSIAGGDTFDYYYNDQHQAVEVRRNGDTDAYEQYVYDQRYIDAPVMVYRDTDTDGTVEQKLYVAQDANFNVTATIDGDTGAVVNRFVYTPYGQRTVLDASWTASTTDFMLGHQGLMLDAESGMYYNRARMYHTALGAFIQRDPLGYVDGGSLYGYERYDPTTNVDPTGMLVASPPVMRPPLSTGNPWGDAVLIGVILGEQIYTSGLGDYIGTTWLGTKLADLTCPGPSLGKPKSWTCKCKRRGPVVPGCPLFVTGTGSTKEEAQKNAIHSVTDSKCWEGGATYGHCACTG